jgi:hypothetical protein
MGRNLKPTNFIEIGILRDVEFIGKKILYEMVAIDSRRQ